MKSEKVTIVADSESGQIRLPGVTVPFSRHANDVLQLDNYVMQLPRPDQRVKINSGKLRSILNAASLPPAWLDGGSLKQLLLAVHSSGDGEQVLEARGFWTGHSDTRAVTKCEASSDVTIAADLDLLLRMVDAAGNHVVTLEAGPGNDMPLRVSSPNGLMMLAVPSRFGLEVWREEFERVLSEVRGGHPHATLRDEADNYVVPLRNGLSAHIILKAGDPFRRIPDYFLIAATIADNVADTREALQEVNAQNMLTPFGRVVMEDGHLAVVASGVLNGVDQSILRNAIETVADVAEGFGEFMGGVHGGDHG